jgi:glycosyltransferase involved in cell wall biosynthesis
MLEKWGGFVRSRSLGGHKGDQMRDKLAGFCAEGHGAMGNLCWTRAFLVHFPTAKPAPMKQVVMLSTSAPGGMAQVVENLRSTGLFERHQIRVISTHDQGNSWKRLRLLIRAYAEFCSLLIGGHVSVVHAHVAMRGSFWRKSVFLTTARLFRRPTIVHLHGSDFEPFYENECGTMRRAIVRSIFRQARAVVVLSEKWRSYISKLEPRARVVVVHNFVDLPAIRASVEYSGVSRSDNTILFLGEIGQRKGIYDLIKAMPSILRRCPDALLVAGGSGELEQVENCARKAGVEHAVSLPGWISGEEKLRALSRAAIYVLPSYYENFPVSILEAMAAGLPVVSTSVGGIPDMIRDGHEGYLVAPGEVVALAEAVGRLLSDRSLRRQLGEQARLRIATRFSSEDAINAFSALYGESDAYNRQATQVTTRGA